MTYVYLDRRFYDAARPYMYIEGKMRPEIPEWLIQKMDEEPKDVNLKHVYEIGGYQTEGEFIRAAVREKIKELNEKHDI